MMRVFIAGAGLIGHKRAAAFGPDDQLMAVVDPVEERAFDLARGTSPSARATSNIGEVLGLAQDGDVAIIATTHDQLAAAATPFAAAGCHLLVEKPGARSSDELQQIQDALLPGRFLAVGFNHRFHPAILLLHELANEGRFGQLRSVRARYGHGGRPGYEKEWRADKERSGGGELLDQGSHLIDLTRFIAGDFWLSHAELANLYWDMPVEDNAWLLGDLPDGGKASLHASWTEWKNLFSFEVFFTKAKVEVRGLGGSYGPETLIASHMEKGFGPPTVTSTEFPPGDTSWSLEWADVKKRIATDGGLGATRDDARAVLEVVGEAYRNVGD